MSKILLFLTDKYPYGNGETFIESERKFWNLFDKIIICPVLLKHDDVIRKNYISRSNEMLIDTREENRDIFHLFSGLFGDITLCDLFRECIQVQGIAKKKSALSMFIFSNLRINRIKRKIKKLIDFENDCVLVYSYWMFEPALVAAGIKKHIKKIRFITRAHGYDLYEERQANNYAPFRKMILGSADSIYCISENGKRYLSDKYNKKYDVKISVERLGIIKLFDDFTTINKNNNIIMIVSCSNMVPLKRIDRIIDVLRIIKKEVIWIHFGDGELMNNLKEQVSTLSATIQVRFMGRVPNLAVQKFYSENNINAFINVSETEGIPVSIMEAQAYGIPVIATDVGGTSELVHNNVNGILLKQDFSNEDLLSAINTIISNSEKFSKNSKCTWETFSNADYIYDAFYTKELKLLSNL